MTNDKIDIDEVLSELVIDILALVGDEFAPKQENGSPERQRLLGLLAEIVPMKLEAKKQILELIVEARQVDENTSDGYHTFKELYEYRMLYNALLFNEWAKNGDYGVHKSKLHSDGEVPFGGGWFVVSAQLPTGQVTNHYELSDWDKFQVPENTRAAKWDGHTPQEAAQRLRAQLKSTQPKTEEGCYCVCHSSFSSNAYCKHCKGDNEVGRSQSSNKGDNYE
jgi:hypothetical protein